MRKIIIFIFLTFLGCQINNDLIIHPMRVVNYNSSYGSQYFEIDNYSKYPDSILMEKILTFSEKEISKNNKLPTKVKTQHFYKKGNFDGCNKKGLLYEEDIGEIQEIIDCNEARISSIIFFQSNDENNDSIFIRNIILWNNNYLKDSSYPGGKRRTFISKNDSILVKDNKWRILKKGKIERN